MAMIAEIVHWMKNIESSLETDAVEKGDERLAAVRADIDRRERVTRLNIASPNSRWNSPGWVTSRERAPDTAEDGWLRAEIVIEAQAIGPGRSRGCPEDHNVGRVAGMWSNNRRQFDRSGGGAMARLGRRMTGHRMW
jgi:hypothetical protein